MSFQVNRFNIIGYKHDPTPLMMLCKDKGSMIRAQYCSKLTGIWYDRLVQFLCSEITELESIYYPFEVFIIDWLLMFANQTQVRADLGNFGCLSVTKRKCTSNEGNCNLIEITVLKMNSDKSDTSLSTPTGY